MPTNSKNIVSQKMHPFSSESKLAEFLTSNFTESLKQAIKVTIKIMIKEEMENIRKEFDEKIHFNGYYPRNMQSTFGQINEIAVPRFRQKPEDFDLKSLSIFDQEKDRFEQLICEMHNLGISQRKVKRLSEIVLGIKISKNKVGKVYRQLVEKEEYQINNQILNDDFVQIIIDGIWVKAKGYGWDDNDATLLCALGIKADGSRKIIGFQFARHEDYENWHNLLSSIKKRGLSGKNLELAISDDNQAIKKALGQLYPSVPIQTCIVHKMRNVMSKTSSKHKAKLAEELKSVFNSKDKEEAMNRSKQFCKHWYVLEEKAIASFKYDLEYCFTYFNFPEHLWTHIRTTNILEREFRELRRRIKVFDSSFNDEQSCTNYANNIFTTLNKYYPQMNITQ